MTSLYIHCVIIMYSKLFELLCSQTESQKNLHAHTYAFIQMLPKHRGKNKSMRQKDNQKIFHIIIYFFLCLSSKSIVSSMYLQSCLVRSLSTQWHFFKDIIKRSLVESDDACTEVIGWNISTWAVTETTIIKSNALHVCQQHSCKDERFRYHIHPFCH